MDWLLIGTLLCAFFILGTARVASAIRIVAVQGVLLSFLPPFAMGGFTVGHSLFLMYASLLIKVIAIPLLLFRSLRPVRRASGAGATTSLHRAVLGGGVIVVLSFASLTVLTMPTAPFPPLVIPVALATVLIGFLLLILRRLAISQVIGFLVLENGVFLFGMTLLADFPLTVEMGVLLDLLVGIFVMGLIVYHINRTFDHIDTSALSALRDG